MTEKLRLTLMRKYRAMWAEAAKILAGGGFTKIETECSREETTIKALGDYKSSSDFTREDFDKVFREIRAITEPDNLNAQVEPPDARLRRQLLWSIAQEEKFPGYAAGISQDIYHRRDFSNLPTPQLLQLRRRVGNDHHGYKVPQSRTRRSSQE